MLTLRRQTRLFHPSFVVAKGLQNRSLAVQDTIDPIIPERSMATSHGAQSLSWMVARETAILGVIGINNTGDAYAPATKGWVVKNASP